MRKRYELQTKVNGKIVAPEYTHYVVKYGNDKEALLSTQVLSIDIVDIMKVLNKDLERDPLLSNHVGNGYELTNISIGYYKDFSTVFIRLKVV